MDVSIKEEAKGKKRLPSWVKFEFGNAPRGDLGSRPIGVGGGREMYGLDHKLILGLKWANKYGLSANPCKWAMK